MTFKINWYMNQLGMTNWTLKKPIFLTKKNKKYNLLSKNINFLILTKDTLNYNIPIVHDVLYTLNISKDQVLNLVPDLMLLSEDFICNSWQIGLDKKILLNGNHIYSPTLDELKRNPVARRSIWQQICAQEQGFFSKKRINN